jgi:hypothetical protein
VTAPRSWTFALGCLEKAESFCALLCSYGQRRDRRALDRGVLIMLIIIVVAAVAVTLCSCTLFVRSRRQTARRG